jgi:hypothetical protein
MDPDFSETESVSTSASCFPPCFPSYFPSISVHFDREGRAERNRMSQLEPRDRGKNVKLSEQKIKRRLNRKIREVRQF